jgi:hypothetical protein
VKSTVSKVVKYIKHIYIQVMNILGDILSGVFILSCFRGVTIDGVWTGEWIY